MSLVRPDYWIPHLSLYAFSVIQHQPQDAPDAAVYIVHPLDYVFAMFITVGLFAFQGVLLTRLAHRGRRWYFGKMKQIDSDETRAQANRTLLALLSSTIMGALTLVSCSLLCANFTMRVWALGLIVKPDDVRYGGAASDNRVNCSVLTPSCLVMTPRFAIAVENLEQATGFMMQIVVLMAGGLFVYRSAVVFRRQLWMYVLTGIPFLVVIVSTIAGVIAIYRNPYEFPRQPGWLYYRYQSNDVFMSTQIAIARITPTITTAALVALNLVFTLSVLATKARVCVRGCVPSLLVDSALPSAVLGVVLLFIPAYGADSDQPFYYMRLARYSLRILWAALLILTPQLVVLKTMRVDSKREQPMDEKTIIESEAGYIKEV